MKNKNISLILIIIVCIFLFIISLLIGSFDLSIEDIINILLGKNDSSIQRNVFYNLRIPRAVMEIYAGAL
ncbi:MAG: iron chelate uptake ABC transporter family permease subunit [Thomasclavelia spiroformis]